MTQKMLAGIDYSLTCPAITIGHQENFDTCKTYYFTSKKKFAKEFDCSLYGALIPKYDHPMERIDNLSEFILRILKMYSVEQVVIEGYSYGSHGRYFDLAENGGLLKWKMWANGIEYIDPAPTVLKKNFTGKGNANKASMHQSFVKKTGHDVSLLLGTDADGNPVSDIVDSYSAFVYNFVK